MRIYLIFRPKYFNPNPAGLEPFVGNKMDSCWNL